MTREEVDMLWFQAMRDSAEAGEQFSRYHFAAAVAAAEREACAKLCEAEAEKWEHYKTDRPVLALRLCSDAIRARGEK